MSGGFASMWLLQPKLRDQSIKTNNIERGSTESRVHFERRIVPETVDGKGSSVSECWLFVSANCGGLIGGAEKQANTTSVELGVFLGGGLDLFLGRGLFLGERFGGLGAARLLCSFPRPWLNFDTP